MPTNQPTMSHDRRIPYWTIAVWVFVGCSFIAFGFMLGCTYAVAQDNAITA